MITLRQMVTEAIEAAGDDPAAVVCVYQSKVGRGDTRSTYGQPLVGSVSDLPTRKFDAGFGSVEGEPFIGFSERFVYVCGHYDGAEWVEVVPRTVEVALELAAMEDKPHENRRLPCIGGG